MRARLMWTLLEIIASLCIINRVQGQQQYILTGPADTQYITNYQQNPTFAQFQPSQSSIGFLQQQQQIDSYLPQRDLQTSDLPYHLQQTLPQYRITTKSPPTQYDFTSSSSSNQFNGNNFQSSRPAPFKATPTATTTRSNNNNIIPSTHRPNYSHLFSHLHQRHPSQPETFLGEITLQSPAELPPVVPPSRYNAAGGGFKPSSASFNNPTPTPANDFGVRTNTVQLNNAGGVRGNFLNHRTRIFAPDNNTKKSSSSSQVKDYFVNNNGDVFITTKVPFVPKPTQSTTPAPITERRNNFVPTAKPTNKPIAFNLKPNKKPFIPKQPARNNFDLESLLEEPIRDHGVNSESDDVVEVVKSQEEVETTTYKEEESTTLVPEVTTLLHLPETEKEEKDSTSELDKSEEEDDTTAEYEDETTLNSSSNEYEDYKSSQEDENNDIRDEEYSSLEEEEAAEENNHASSSPLPPTPEEPQTELPETETELPLNLTNPEPVISVVTTKSVINNTVIAPAVTPIPPVTQEMPPTSEETSTDTWVVVASVQTSRSVSGARYLPSSIVEQEQERVKLLNEGEGENEEEVSQEETTETTTSSPEEEETTTLKLKTSTESLIDKLDRVQSDLSSSLSLSGGFKEEGNNIAVITENMSEKMATTMIDIVTTEETTSAKNLPPAVQIRKFSPHSRPSTTARSKKVFNSAKYKNRMSSTSTTSPVDDEDVQGDQPQLNETGTTGRRVSFQDVVALLPQDNKEIESSSKLVEDIIRKSKINLENTARDSDLVKVLKKDDIAAFLPPGYKPPADEDDKLVIKKDEISSLLEKEVKQPEEEKEEKIKIETVKQDDLSAFLPPGYKGVTTPDKNSSSSSSSLLDKIKTDDISAFLPPGYKSFKPSSTTSTTQKPTKSKGVEGLLNEARPVDVSAFLPPGYKPRSTTHKPPTTISETEKVPTSLLPVGYKFRGSFEGRATTEAVSTTSTSTTAKPASGGGGGGFKVVFPSRPGGGARKSPHRLTTPRTRDGNDEVKANTPPSIQRGWPSRATTEFTGWPTPSTTPISIEKLLEAARAAASSTTEAEEEVAFTSTTTTTTTTTTTQKPTTPGICVAECDLAGTIKLVGGAKWVPELLDRNTKEWQILANEVQVQLEDVYSRSNILNKWYKKIRIDGFSEGSVLVDYLVELNDLGRQIDTLEIKKLFHESLDDALTNSVANNREGKALNESVSAKMEEKLSLGSFVVDPKYTDFIVLPKQAYPTVGYAEDNVLLPQWAIAVIVIGLASLLFVIIFGVTVLVNRQKNAKKKAPTPLTDDMLNELNKNHMGGFDNYGAEDLYNMEDVWNERAFDQKPPKKRSSGSIHDNSMSNLYDSWRSEWNGYYYNAYYGNNPGSSSQHSGYGRRRSDYDTNF